MHKMPESQEEGHSPDVVGVGNFFIDNMYRLTHLPEPDDSAFITGFDRGLGGVAANVLSLLSQWGHQTGAIARLGNDSDGQQVIEELSSRNIDSDHVRLRPSDESTYSMIFRDSSGQRMIIAGGNSTTRLRLHENDLSYLNQSMVTFTSAYVPPDVLTKLSKDMSDDTRLVFDLSARFKEISHHGFTREVLDEAISAIDLFIANKTALFSYLELDDLDEAIKTLQEKGISSAAVTLGSEGAIIINGNKTIEIPAFDVSVVDTTGAGDAFAAGLIHSWVLSEETTDRAGLFASAAAGLSCERKGAQGDLPTLEEIQNLFDDHD